MICIGALNWGGGGGECQGLSQQLHHISDTQILFMGNFRAFSYFDNGSISILSLNFIFNFNYFIFTFEVFHFDS